MPPVNDDFASATTISGSSGSVTGSNVGATFEGSEPVQEAGDGSNTVWWEWTAPADGDYTFSLAGSDFDTVIEAYTGGALGSLSLVDYDDDGGPGVTSELTFTAAAGTTYRLRVHGYDDTEEGSIHLAWVLFDPFAPDVTGFDISYGVPGATVHADGTNLDHTAQLIVGGLSASFAIIDSTHLSFVVPNVRESSVTVEARNASGGSAGSVLWSVYFPGAWIQAADDWGPNVAERHWPLDGYGPDYTVDHTSDYTVPDPIGSPTEDFFNGSNFGVFLPAVSGENDSVHWTMRFRFLGVDFAVETNSDNIDTNAPPTPIGPGDFPDGAFELEYEHPHSAILGSARFQRLITFNTVIESVAHPGDGGSDPAFDQNYYELLIPNDGWEYDIPSELPRLIPDEWPDNLTDYEVLGTYPAVPPGFAPVQEEIQPEVWFSSYASGWVETIVDIDDHPKWATLTINEHHVGGAQLEAPERVMIDTIFGPLMLFAERSLTSDYAAGNDSPPPALWIINLRYRPSRYRFLYDTPQIKPPQRQYPRDDGLGISTRRSWPPPTSKQYGSRRGPTATYW